jgi:DNA helicase-2/ATP-dependent DNA helicase PcrA
MRNIAEFAKDFPGSTTILLEQNYRSTQNILSAANAVISKNFDRPEKNLWTDAGDGEKIISFTGLDERAEAAYVVDQISELRESSVAYRDIAILYRTNALSPSLEAELKSQRIPYAVIGGLKFYERKEIKDALAYLTAIANPRDDEAIRRVLNEPSRGIGEKTELKIAELARREEISFRQALGRTDILGLGPKLTNALTAFSKLLNELDAMAVESKIADVLSAALNLSGYRGALEDSRDPQDEARVDNLDALIGQVFEYQRQNPDATIAEYLADITLAAAADEIDDDSGSVSLMTLHTAKGLEYEVIFLVGLEQGTLPHVRSFDEPGGVAEERRLLYVGMTRARARLYLTSALQRTLFGSTTAFLPSSFLGDIPPELLQTEGAERASGGYIAGGFRGMGLSTPSASLKPKTQIDGAIREVRDNSSLQLVVGDRIKHADYGEGTVASTRGEGPKQVAEVKFDAGATKALVVKIAPIEKL